MRLTLDFETASNCDLKEAGAWRYAEAPTTEILCAAWVVDGHHSSIWTPGIDDHLLKLLRQYAVWDQVIFEAHNAGFEQAIWHYIMERQYGMPPIPVERWDCTMARCLYNGLPAKLETAAQVLGLTEQKDMEGSALTISLSKPMTIKTWMARLVGP
jgi:DNA polymerase